MLDLFRATIIEKFTFLGRQNSPSWAHSLRFLLLSRALSSRQTIGAAIIEKTAVGPDKQ
jgi:hypothetical protein